MKTYVIAAAMLTLISIVVYVSNRTMEMDDSPEYLAQVKAWEAEYAAIQKTAYVERTGEYLAAFSAELAVVKKYYDGVATQEDAEDAEKKMNMTDRMAIAAAWAAVITNGDKFEAWVVEWKNQKYYQELHLAQIKVWEAENAAIQKAEAEETRDGGGTLPWE